MYFLGRFLSKQYLNLVTYYYLLIGWVFISSSILGAWNEDSLCTFCSSKELNLGHKGGTQKCLRCVVLLFCCSLCNEKLISTKWVKETKKKSNLCSFLLILGTVSKSGFYCSEYSVIFHFNRCNILQKSSLAQLCFRESQLMYFLQLCLFH